MECTIDNGLPNWQHARDLRLDGQKIQAISWGLDKEVLVTDRNLQLYHISRSNSLSRHWYMQLATPACTAHFSPDTSLIASHGIQDRLVKIWRRLSPRVSAGGHQTADFDFTYLVHPRSVTSTKWRQPLHDNLMVDNIMYTTCVDGILRVWASDIPHDSHLLTLHASINMVQDGPNRLLYTPVIIDDEMFAQALSKADKRQTERGIKSCLFQKLGQAQPEIVLLIGQDGSLNVWSLANVGSRYQKPVAQNLTYALTMSDIPRLDDGTRVYPALYNSSSEVDLMLYACTPNNIYILGVDMGSLFSNNKKILVSTDSWDGHTSPLVKLSSLSDGQLMSSTDQSGKTCFWRLDEGHTLRSLAISDAAVEHVAFINGSVPLWRPPL